MVSEYRALHVAARQTGQAAAVGRTHIPRAGVGIPLRPGCSAFASGNSAGMSSVPFEAFFFRNKLVTTLSFQEIVQPAA